MKHHRQGLYCQSRRPYLTSHPPLGKGFEKISGWQEKRVTIIYVYSSARKLLNHPPSVQARSLADNEMLAALNHYTKDIVTASFRPSDQGGIFGHRILVGFVPPIIRCELTQLNGFHQK